MAGLTLDSAKTIADAALAAGREQGFMPLTVAVLDAGGHLVAFLREDRSGILRPEVAVGKAYGALGMGMSSRTLRDALGDRPAFQGAIAAATDGRFVPVPGGVLILNAKGIAIGAAGVSGDSSECDEFAAITAIKQAGLASLPAEPDANWQA